MKYYLELLNYIEILTIGQFQRTFINILDVQASSVGMQSNMQSHRTWPDVHKSIVREVYKKLFKMQKEYYPLLH